MRGADEPRRLADCGMPLYFNVLPARERTVVVAMVTARRHASGDAILACFHFVIGIVRAGSGIDTMQRRR